MTTNSNNIIYNIDQDYTRYNELNYINIVRTNDMNYNDYIYNYVINNVINNYLYQDIIIPNNERKEIEFTSNPEYIGEICSICVECVENVETMAVTGCSHKPHVFHKTCIAIWIKKSHKCPNCRTDMC